MSRVYIVVDNLKVWEPYYPSERIISFSDYLSLTPASGERIRIINLCEDYDYLREGYYCSLLAEARGHHVIPSIRVLNDISQPLLYQLQLSRISSHLDKLLKSRVNEGEIHVKSYFGNVADPDFKLLARQLFEKFACPILSFTLRYNNRWEITAIDAVQHHELNDNEQTEFAEALDHFSSKIWREPRQHKPARYDIAILINPEEKLPPSDKQAINKFIKAGKGMGVNVETITPSDYIRLQEYDALFIRETTAIDHHTYRFAKKAESEGMVVIDDPTSIMRCTNKIYLAKLFETHKVPTPKTLILQKGHPEQLDSVADELGFPLILKIPDGSFSRGVVKVDNQDEFRTQTEALFDQSSLLLAQAYMYTQYDWRIGILNNKPLYACRYYMVKSHWQIYSHAGNSVKSGGFDTLPTFEVPKAVLQAAVKATKPIGDGLYGVDVKESDGKGYVIEVNDNPSLDSGVEDLYLGNELYNLILENLVERIEKRKALLPPK
jgi:glutathione synthase/RimK-type ligase-like ATP-grasp enzyme